MHNIVNQNIHVPSFLKIDESDHKYGLSHHIKKISEAHKQTKQSIYVLFLTVKKFFKAFLLAMQLVALSCWDLVRKGAKERSLTLFHAMKGGEKR